ncbi:HVA22-like protein i isoform X2 [Amborella trichopoda]|uniref:HVA22-like protein i isoform X2 n=1 Tax=Amborella trichopoda TaxID=13333 RepID=UPI0009BF6911|nr:HVA22-like protein i isoform X2 [Amborella trichopoda]|eukprot:XP_020524386.1 HVA22-like protein i isoform X2 [Amborella trichopoda]
MPASKQWKKTSQRLINYVFGVNIVAMLTVFERVGDTFVSWVPMYSEAKVAFLVYLWYPKTLGTSYVYETFLRPYVAKHETEIDRNLLELRARAGDIVVQFWQKATSYGQTRIFEILQYVASQSSRPAPAQVLTRILDGCMRSSDKDSVDE